MDYLHMFKSKNIQDANHLIEIHKTEHDKTREIRALLEKNNINLTHYDLLIMYYIYYFPNTIDIHYPISTYSRFLSVNKFCVQTLDGILMEQNSDTLKFKYYFNHFKDMLEEWQKKENNIRFYLTATIINNKKDEILLLSLEDMTKYLIYDHWIEKKYKEIFNYPNIQTEIKNVLEQIFKLLSLNNLNLKKVEYELLNDEVQYFCQCFDLVVNTLDIKLLDIFYLNVKNNYMNNKCTYNKTFIILSIISIVFFSCYISEKLSRNCIWLNTYLMK